jgi:hypothetical protein
MAAITDTIGQVSTFVAVLRRMLAVNGRIKECNRSMDLTTCGGVCTIDIRTLGWGKRVQELDTVEWVAVLSFVEPRCWLTCREDETEAQCLR